MNLIREIYELALIKKMKIEGRQSQIIFYQLTIHIISFIQLSMTIHNFYKILSLILDLQMAIDYGPFRPLHTKTFAYLWCPLVNIIILAATFKHSHIAMFIHNIGSFLLSLFTLVITLPMLFKAGIADSETHKAKHDHIIIGIFCLSVIFLQLVLGIWTRFCNLWMAKSQAILNIRRLHMILGLITWLLCKFQVLRFVDDKERNLFILLEAIFIIFYIFNKWFRKTMNASQQKSREIQNSKIVMISALKDLNCQNKNKEVAIFNNLVYDLQPLREWHPAGFQIVQSFKNTQLDKFIYGIYSSSLHPTIDAHPHSANSFNLMDKPIAKINIPSIYANLFNSNQVIVKDLKRLNQKQSIFQIYLSRIHQPFLFKGYKQLKQIGRYYSLTVDNQLTRLYTCANFINSQNISFLQQHLSSQQLDKYFKNRGNYLNQLPLLFKHYQTGVMTSKLINNRFNKLQLSEEKGLGLQLEEIKAGKIILVGGGTGIYPFSDLIDLLYKEQLIMTQPALKQTVFQMNQILKSGISTKFSFKIYFSLSSIQQLHPVTLQQLLYLAHNSKSVEVCLRVKQPFHSTNFRNIKLMEDRFENLLIKQIDDQNIRKIIICGPARMNEALTAALMWWIKNTQKIMIL